APPPADCGRAGSSHPPPRPYCPRSLRPSSALPICGRLPRDSEGARHGRDGLTSLHTRNKLLSTIGRQSGILVDVHPGLLIRVSNDLAATTFPRSAWVNNLLPRHI